MLLKLLGVTIATGKDRDPVVINNAVGLAVQSQEVSVTPIPSPSPKPEMKTVKVDLASLLHPLTKSIPWPDPGDDPWKRTIVKAAIMSFNKSAEYGHFSVCPIRDLRKDLHLLLTEEGELALERLRTLHCVDFSMMEDEVFDAIVPLTKLIFTTRKMSQYIGHNVEWIFKN